MPIGNDVWFSVRADLMNTGEKQDMANRVEGKYIASEFLGSLETDVFEVAPGQYVHVEQQHRHAQDHIYKMGDRETLCWNAEAAVLLEDLLAGEPRCGVIVREHDIEITCSDYQRVRQES